jgi:hypothetical protein
VSPFVYTVGLRTAGFLDAAGPGPAAPRAVAIVAALPGVMTPCLMATGVANAPPAAVPDALPPPAANSLSSAASLLMTSKLPRCVLLAPFRASRELGNGACGEEEWTFQSA